MAVVVTDVRMVTLDGAVPGNPVDLELTVHASQFTRIHRAQLKLIAAWGYRDKSWTSQWRSELTNDGSTIYNVSAGISQIRTRARLPAHVLPTFSNRDLLIRSGLTAYVSIRPQGFLARTTVAEFNIDLGTVAPSELTSISMNFPNDGAVVSVDLSRRAVALGLPFQTTVTFASPVANDTNIEATLTPSVRVRNRVHPAGNPIPLGTQLLSAGNRIAAIQGTVPANATPTCSNTDIDVTWALTVLMTSSVWDQPRQLQVPIILYGSETESPVSDVDAPAEWRTNHHRGGRLRRLFAAASNEFRISQLGDPARKYWSVSANRTIGDLETSIIFRSGDTQSLEIHIAGFDLELGLYGDVAATRLTSRHEEQLQPFRQQVIPALNNLINGDFTIDDEQVYFQQPGLPIDLARIQTVASHVETLANALMAARAAILPPPDLQVDLAALRALAAEWSGTLRVGELVVSGSDGVSRVRAHPYQEVLGISVGIQVEIYIGARRRRALRAAKLVVAAPSSGIDPVRGDEVSGVSPAILEQLITWPADIVSLRLGLGSAAAVWKFPTSNNGEHRPIVEAERIRGLYNLLSTLLASFTQGNGPYR